jgi:hypothetical protein
LRQAREVHPASAQEKLFNSFASYIPEFEVRHTLHPDARKNASVSLNHELAFPTVAGGRIIAVVGPTQAERKRF